MDRLAWLWVLLVLVGATSCAIRRVEPAELGEAYRTLGPCALNDRGLSHVSARALREMGHAKGEANGSLVKVRGKDIRWIEPSSLPAERRASVVQALAEKAIALGNQEAKASPEVALGHFLLAADWASYLTGQYTPDQGPFMYELSQFATARVVELLDFIGDSTSSSLDPGRAVRIVEASGRRYRLSLASSPTRPRIDPARLRSLEAADRLRVGLAEQVKQRGLGAPFVAQLDGASETYQPRESYFHPVSALLEFEAREVVLSFYDLRVTGGVASRDSRRVERVLAADFSAAWARQVDADPNKRAILGMLRPAQFTGHMGLTLTEPFRPDAIPVVFIHGLASNGATWDATINGLLADRRIRERFQFWLYQYPSGYPFVYPAADLRRTLRELRRHYDPLDRLPTLDQIVLVGHSMGGLISSAQVREADQNPLGAFLKRPLNELTISDDTKDRLRDFLAFRPEGYIRRVVFVATPHRGSTIADGWIGRLFSRLIELPTDLLSFNLTGIVQELTDTGLSMIDLAPNSVTRLQYYNPVLKTLVELPLDERVMVHSIVGDRGLGNAPKSFDGVVSYASSHLEAAHSEKIVPAWHSVHRHPEAIAEIRRILHAHLDGQDTREARARRRPGD